MICESYPQLQDKLLLRQGPIQFSFMPQFSHLLKEDNYISLPHEGIINPNSLASEFKMQSFKVEKVSLQAEQNVLPIF